MAWGTQEQKGDLLKMGAQAFFSELQKEFETNRILRDSKKDGDKIDPAFFMNTFGKKMSDWSQW